ncbi:hypothetical protein D3C76_1394420 [compost metagenome]
MEGLISASFTERSRWISVSSRLSGWPSPFTSFTFSCSSGWPSDPPLMSTSGVMERLISFSTCLVSPLTVSVLTRRTLKPRPSPA